MKTPPKYSYRGVIILFFLGAFAGLFPAVGEEKPWYAARLQSLGFQVFDPAFEFKDFTVLTLEGGMKKRSSLQGKLALLNFWATWCPPCKEEMPSIEALGKAMKGLPFEIFAVDLGDSPAEVKAFVKERNIGFPVYLDPKKSLAATYASRGIPTTYLIGKDGKFIAGIVGAYDYSNPALVSLLKEMAAR
ncbi:MAG TPA: TlpA disulfide reductase family protein [Rectinemataceae bacterium]